MLAQLTVVCMLLLCAVRGGSGRGVWKGEESYREELTFEPLANGHGLARFQFSFEAQRPPEGAHSVQTDLFPAAWGRVVASSPLRDLHLSLTRGRWDPLLLGSPPPGLSPAPPGAELWLSLPLINSSASPIDAQEESLKRLTSMLSGLLCLSLNQLRPQHLVVTPLDFFAGSRSSADLRFLLGALPREPVCTENLAPLLKLLPCRDQAGLASLLQPRAVLSSHYHSFSLSHLSHTSSSFVTDQMQLVLSLAIVFDLSSFTPLSRGTPSISPSPSLSTLLSATHVPSSLCLPADFTHVATAGIHSSQSVTSPEQLTMLLETPLIINN
ncbi:MAG: hypothetical protein Q8P67_08350, partial [archaeon]|nr:hypothetical protein [archaeon]